MKGIIISVIWVDQQALLMHAVGMIPNPTPVASRTTLTGRQHFVRAVEFGLLPTLPPESRIEGWSSR